MTILKKITFLIFYTPQQSTFKEQFSSIASEDLFMAYSPMKEALPKLFDFTKTLQKTKIDLQ